MYSVRVCALLGEMIAQHLTPMSESGLFVNVDIRREVSTGVFLECELYIRMTIIALHAIRESIPR